MRFVKMHGNGNDFVLVDLWREKVPSGADLARQVCDRHFGVGADGLILVGPSVLADARMAIFNSDGSEAEMCGNGIRCVAKYCFDCGIHAGAGISVETRAGVKRIGVAAEGGRMTSACVDMGAPRLERGQIPMLGPAGERCFDDPFEVEGRRFQRTCVSMGNPHCVLFVPSVDAIPLSVLGPAVENHPDFPQRTNVHFAEVTGRDSVRMVTWERGAGATLACGTGAAAVVVAGVVTGRTGRGVVAAQPGGRLALEWRPDGRVYMSGPAAFVCEGVWPEPSPST